MFDTGGDQVVVNDVFDVTDNAVDVGAVGPLFGSTVRTSELGPSPKELYANIRT